MEPEPRPEPRWISVSVQRDSFDPLDPEQVRDVHEEIVAGLVERGLRIAPGKDYQMRPRHTSGKSAACTITASVRTLPLEEA